MQRGKWTLTKVKDSGFYADGENGY